MAISIGKKVHWRRWFKDKRKRAEKLLMSAGAAENTADRAMAKAERVSKLSQGLADVFTLGRLARAWARGEYRQISRTTIIMVMGALVYFLSPIDAILDTIPVIGFIDDAMVLAWVVSEIKAELTDFRGWEARQGQQALPPTAPVDQPIES
jgi:uncharacterized membrane protein YkvA (DUF1232 family)